MTLTFKNNLNFRAADRAVEAGAEDGVREAADDVLSASQRLVPVATGTLRDSARVSTDGLRAAVFYSADYATIVHERLDLYHPDGQPKFLENAQDSQRGESLTTVAAAIRRRT